MCEWDGIYCALKILISAKKLTDWDPGKWFLLLVMGEEKLNKR